MSEEQLSALLAKLKVDAELRKKLKGAANFDAAVAMAKEAGFDVSMADWLRYQVTQTLELSDEELEGVSGAGGTRDTICQPKYLTCEFGRTKVCCEKGWP
jgi:predicted ribosomally synthesized peptide with nif11-like leader